jgi:hypothetical protein
MDPVMVVTRVVNFWEVFPRQVILIVPIRTKVVFFRILHMASHIAVTEAAKLILMTIVKVVPKTVEHAR